jgi:rhodanese-related sulfurtransferase
MKILLIVAAVILTYYLATRLSTQSTYTPQDAAKQIASGEALLVDVREPSECASGVAGPAHLLPLSDLRGDRAQWKPFLEQNRDKELLVYCRSGKRSGIAADILRGEGCKVTNIGSYGAWQNAGLPTRQP